MSYVLKRHVMQKRGSMQIKKKEIEKKEEKANDKKRKKKEEGEEEEQICFQVKNNTVNKMTMEA